MEEAVIDRKETIRAYIGSFSPEALMDLKPTFIRARLEAKGMQIDSGDMKIIRGIVKYLRAKFRTETPKFRTETPNLLKRKVSMAANIRDILEKISDTDLAETTPGNIYAILSERGFELNLTMRSSVSKFLKQEKKKRRMLNTVEKPNMEEVRKTVLDLFILANGDVECLVEELNYIKSLSLVFKEIYSR